MLYNTLMFKKFFKLSLFLFFFFAITSNASAQMSPQISANEITAYSVRLNLFNFALNTNYSISLVSDTGERFLNNVRTDGTGAFQVIFNNLKSDPDGVGYNAYVSAVGDQRFLATTSFKTKSSGITFSNVTGASATIRATGLDGYEPVPDNTYVVSLRAPNIRYDKNTNATGGNIEVFFDRLLPNKSYEVFISRGNDTSNFVLKGNLQTLPATFKRDKITATSASFIADGLDISYKYNFSVQTNTGLLQILSTPNTQGVARADFTFNACEKTPCPTFTAYIKRVNTNGSEQDVGLTPIQFSLVNSTLNISNLTTDSVTIQASGLNPGDKVEFWIGGVNENKQVEVSSSGIAEVSFSGLKEDFEYEVVASKINENQSQTRIGDTRFKTSAKETTNDIILSEEIKALGNGLIPCGTKKDPKTGVVLEPCTYKHLFDLINNVVNFILYFLAIPIAAIMFAYAGFLYLSSQGDTSKVSKATGIFGDVAMGLIYIAAAWLIIKTVLSILGYDGSWIGF